MKIAFCESQFDIRGTTVALYDYARYNEELLGNESIILVPKEGFLKSEIKAIIRLVSRFKIFTFTNNLDEILKEQKCDVLYCIKYGTNDGICSKVCKTVIHCVFDMSQPHGDVYAGVSKTVADKYNQKLFVPHMISLKPSETNENHRESLGIPEDAIVFGRYGGDDTMNLNFCWKVIEKILNDRQDIYFVFINTPKKIVHDRVFYLPKVTTETDKNKFICTCDAYIECGNLGHSFGLAIGEFSVNNKPIIAYAGTELWNTCHIEILGKKGLYYNDEKGFYNILNSFRPCYGDFNCYKEYTPEKVMEIFSHVFLK